MTATTRLEDIFPIPGRSYSTDSEWLDGLIIGLVTMLLIRNVELVIIDTLTFIFGNRKHGICFRVLRVWQMLSMNNIYNLLTGFDSDIPSSCFGSSCNGRGSRVPTLLRRRIRKGNFAGFLFISVLLGKLLVLGAEVAIIAFVIPCPNVHNSEGGLSIKWKNTTITEASLSEMDTCQRLITSEILTDSAQFAVCKIVPVPEQVALLPKKWISNGSLILEEIDLTHESVRKGGGFVNERGEVICNVSRDGALVNTVSLPSLARIEPALPLLPNVFFRNEKRQSRITIFGDTTKSQDGTIHDGDATIVPVFSDTQKMLLPAFTNIFTNEWVVVGGKALTLNGKLLFSSNAIIEPLRYTKHRFCPGALSEIERVAGTLHPELIVDLFRSSMTVVAAEKFSQPFPDRKNVYGFEIGTSKKFRIQPEWMALAALTSILLSAVTSRLNRTEQRMARVYREHNNMWGACSPAFLDEENVAESGLFQRGKDYHWGESPGADWEKVSTIDFSEDVTLT